MGLFRKKIGPVFMKESSDAELFIEKMEDLKFNSSGSLKDDIDKQIRLAKYGLIGERNVAYELKNSDLDMYIIHDLYLEYGDMNAQIDYLVVTRKHIYVIECKNLFGNIEIDNSGNFIRSYELLGKYVKEGIYSPITQNQRHMRILKEIRKTSKQNIFSKFLFERNFDNNYKSIIVLANPKTYLNSKYAKKEVKEQVIRADQLISYIKKTDNADTSIEMDENTMYDLAQFYLNSNQPTKSNYVQKYDVVLTEATQEKTNCSLSAPASEEINSSTTSICCDTSTSNEALIKELKSYRLAQSRSENIKPYFIFNDNQMQDLIQKNPSNKNELLEVSGFGNKKVDKYGEVILEILRKYPKNSKS